MVELEDSPKASCFPSKMDIKPAKEEIKKKNKAKRRKILSGVDRI